jgi:hypothetical protein
MFRYGDHGPLQDGLVQAGDDLYYQGRYLDAPETLAPNTDDAGMACAGGGEQSMKVGIQGHDGSLFNQRHRENVRIAGAALTDVCNMAGIPALRGQMLSRAAR